MKRLISAVVMSAVAVMGMPTTIGAAAPARMRAAQGSSTVTGTVTGPTGPVANATVNVVGNTGMILVTVRTAQNGTFTATIPATPGTLLINVLGPTGGVIGTATFTVTAGGKATVNVPTAGPVPVNQARMQAPGTRGGSRWTAFTGITGGIVGVAAGVLTAGVSTAVIKSAATSTGASTATKAELAKSLTGSLGVIGAGAATKLLSLQATLRTQAAAAPAGSAQRAQLEQLLESTNNLVTVTGSTTTGGTQNTSVSATTLSNSIDALIALTNAVLPTTVTKITNVAETGTVTAVVTTGGTSVADQITNVTTVLERAVVTTATGVDDSLGAIFNVTASVNDVATVVSASR